MELCGKPDEFSRQCWDSEKSRSEKWQRFLSEPLGPYPFIESFIGFLKHISPCNDYCQELVEIMFNMTDRMMQSYFIGGPLDESPIESKKIADAVLCLEMMEMEGSLFLFYRFETIENEREGAAKVTTKPRTGNTEGVQPQNETEGKNGDTELSVNQRVKRVYGNFSREELRKLVIEADVEEQKFKFKVSTVKSYLEEFEPLRLALKQKHMLQYMEFCGKPYKFSRQCWDLEKSRSEKWQRFLSEPLGPYPFIESFIGFLKHISPCNDYCQELVEIMFNMTDRMMQSYFIGGPLDESPIESKKIADARDLESIRYVSKLQFILETLEWYGKPEKVDRHYWNFEVAPTAKWKQIFAERSENHCLVQRFLDSLKTSIPTEEERLQSIETIFLECHDMLLTYFLSDKIPLDIFKDQRLVTIVGCLEMMDDEISKFHRIQKM
ncbi:hypothetical protein V9T40_008132 [Parthenolecanium corni]|uniref:Uncharacterized protein n=1 Tax=Parthenolecanium corni TaxID=536013 RepID=A0AAN9U1M5_9HEMI